MKLLYDSCDAKDTQTSVAEQQANFFFEVRPTWDTMLTWFKFFILNGVLL